MSQKHIYISNAWSRMSFVLLPLTRKEAMSMKVNDTSISNLISDIENSKAQPTSSGDDISIIISALHKRGYSIVRLYYQERLSELPIIAFVPRNRGYEIIFNTSLVENRRKEMCIAAVVIMCGKDALEEYSIYYSLDDLFSAHPSLKACYLRLIAIF